MSVNDPISDFIARIKNASTRRQPEVVLPCTKACEGIARVLLEEKYLEGVKSEKIGKNKYLTIKLKYDQNLPAIRGMRRVSKPGVRIYTKSSGIHRVLGGLGIVILSTPSGILSGKNARKSHFGGEVICEVW